MKAQLSLTNLDALTEDDLFDLRDCLQNLQALISCKLTPSKNYAEPFYKTRLEGKIIWFDPPKKKC